MLATPWPEFRLLSSELADGGRRVVIDCWRLLEPPLPDGCEYIPFGRGRGGPDPALKHASTDGAPASGLVSRQSPAGARLDRSTSHGCSAFAPGQDLGEIVGGEAPILGVSHDR